MNSAADGLDDCYSAFSETEASSVDSFGVVTEMYVSAKGYMRLLRTSRYGKTLVLKTLKAECRNVEFYRQALQKEFQIGYRLDHPHICRTLGLEDMPNEGTCLVLEYIDGETLTQYIEEGKLTRASARKIISELCDALQYLHSKQIVHRDLKPDNILITYNGENVKLIDFSLSDCDDSILLKLPAGTRRYMAPEACERGYVPTLQADIYSLGVVIGEMSDRLSDRVLRRVAARCTRRVPERRYRSAADVARDVEKTSHGRGALIGLVAIGLAALATGYMYMRPAETKPVEYPVYGNAAESSECRRLIQLKEESLKGGTLTEADSVELMHGIESALQVVYPTEQLQRTPTYRRLVEYWRQEVSALRQRLSSD